MLSWVSILLVPGFVDRLCKSPHKWPSTPNLLSKPSFHGGQGRRGRVSWFRLGMGVSTASELASTSLPFPFGVFINDLKGPWWRQCYHIAQLQASRFISETMWMAWGYTLHGHTWQSGLKRRGEQLGPPVLPKCYNLTTITVVKFIHVSPYVRAC